MQRRLIFAAIVCLLWAALPAAGREKGALPSIFNGVDQAAMNQWVDAQMQNMTLEERIGQLFVMAVDPRDDEATRALVKRLVQESKVGGLIYNESTIMQQVTITNYAQSLASIPLMITIDGEWGLAMRVEGTPTFQRNLALGAIDDDKLLYDYGREVARELRRIGIHVNFAPVLDVNDNPQNPVIGSRSFGESPEQVARHSISYARGLEDGGVLSVGKHFPGHGSSVEDSHKTLPVINKSMQELNTCELVPFRRYIDAGLSGILTAHLYVPAIDKKLTPTTMSKRCVNDLLKKKMHFNGLIFTDALMMEGATKYLKGSACVNALLAGNDVLLMPKDATTELQAVVQAVNSGKIKKKDIDERCRKMLMFKYALGLNKPQKVNVAHLSEDINAPEAQIMQRKLTAATITVVKNNGDILPVSHLDKHNIAVVTMGDDKGEKSIVHRRADDYTRIHSIDFERYDSPTKLTAMLLSGNYDMVIVAVNADDSAYKTALQAVIDACPNVVVSLFGKPYRLTEYGDVIARKRVKAAVMAYDNDELTKDYAIQTIFGGNDAIGALPISMQCGDSLLMAGHGFHYQANRLGYTIPAEVGINNRLLHQVDSVLLLGIREHAFPGCQVVIGRHGKIVCDVAYGTIDYESKVPVTDNTIFGLASVSKATGTLSAVMKVYDEQGFQLDEPASNYIDGLKGTDKAEITFRDLLYHETGMPPSLSMWDMMMDKRTYSGKLITNTPDENHSIKIMNDAYGHNTARLRRDILSTEPTERFPIAIADGIYGGKVTYDSIMNRIYNVNLGEKKYRYSCLNFCLLANAMQNITGVQLNDYVERNIFLPLGAYTTMYRPLSRYSRDRIAFTELDTYLRRQHIHGYVHDELAAFSGGVQGNAGLFSSANDLAKLLQMWLNGGTYGGERFLQPSTVEVFTTQKSPNSHRGLGFDKPVVGDPDASNTCPEATPETFGHTGFTGTRFWVDPANDMFFIFFSNRVSPTRNNPNFGRISASSHIQSLIYENITQ
ncbi:MAG: serine hydrolase [Muribaculaceae bacterium]|nr:serine hydrolase [Muribaculaceae bacterium]